MPELTAQQQQMLLEKLSHFWTNRPCDVCQAEQWVVAPRVHMLLEFRRDRALVGEQHIIPVIPVQCTRCGNSRLVNAIYLGVINPETGEWVDG